MHVDDAHLPVNYWLRCFLMDVMCFAYLSLSIYLVFYFCKVIVHVHVYADGMANSADPNQIAPSSLGLHDFCPDMHAFCSIASCR